MGLCSPAVFWGGVGGGLWCKVGCIFMTFNDSFFSFSFSFFWFR